TEALGLAELRSRLAQFYRARYGVTVPSERIVITTGSSGAFLLAFLAAFDAGDKGALTAPSYPAYKNILSALGIEAIEIPVGEETHFQPTPEVLAKYAGTIDGLIVASPS